LCYAALNVTYALASIRGTPDDRLDALIRAADALGLLEDAFHTLAAPEAEQGLRARVLQVPAVIRRFRPDRNGAVHGCEEDERERAKRAMPAACATV
jgi:hypothetical protein